MYLCICKAVSDTQIRQAVSQGARTVSDVSARLGVTRQTFPNSGRHRRRMDRNVRGPVQVRGSSF